MPLFDYFVSNVLAARNIASEAVWFHGRTCLYLLGMEEEIEARIGKEE
jgi:hypothetical protein